MKFERVEILGRLKVNNQESVETMSSFQNKASLDAARIARLLSSALLAIAGVLSVVGAIAQQEAMNYWREYIDFAPLVLAAQYGIAITIVWPITCLVFSGLGFFVNKLGRFWGLGSFLATLIILILNWALAGFVMASSPQQPVKFSFGIGFGVWLGQFGADALPEETAAQVLLIISLIGSLFFISKANKIESQDSDSLQGNANAKIVRLRSADGESVGFLRSLFDFTFDTFIYVKVASVTYFLILVALALANLFIFIGTVIAVLQSQLPAGYLLLVPVILIGSLFLVILTRLTLESGVALIKIAENTRKK